MTAGRSHFALLGLALAGVVVVAACFSEHTPTTPNAQTPPTTNVGDIFFTSALNGSSNPAVDTVAVNGTVTWTWAAGAARTTILPVISWPCTAQSYW